jgi:hypothetical protein
MREANQATGTGAHGPGTLTELEFDLADLIELLGHCNTFRPLAKTGRGEVRLGLDDGGGILGPPRWMLAADDIVAVLELGANLARHGTTPDVWNRVLDLLGWQPDLDDDEDKNQHDDSVATPLAGGAG